MADIKVQGYVTKVQTRQGSKGAFTTFTLKERVKDDKAPGGKRTVFYSVMLFKDIAAPADDSFVRLEGWLKPREYELNGVKRLSLDVIAQSIDTDSKHGTTPKAPPPPATEVGGAFDDLDLG